MSSHKPESFADAIDSLRQLDQDMREREPSSACDERVFATLDKAAQATPASSPLLGWHFAAVAALLLALLAGYLVVQRPWRGHRELPGGFVLLRGQVRVVPRGPQAVSLVQCATTRCQLQHPVQRVLLQLHQSARVAHAKEQLYMLRGKATFDVAKRASGEAPLLVRVSHGVVKVLGTRFTIVQGVGEGNLELHHGRVQFLHRKGPGVLMLPGDTLRWPMAPPNKPPAPPQRPITRRAPAQRRAVKRRPQRRVTRRLRKSRRIIRPRVRRRALLALPLSPRPRTVPTPKPAQKRLLPPTLMISDWLRRLETLRSLRKFPMAARLLRRDLQRLAEPVHRQTYRQVREILHYELGSLYTHQLSQPKQACRHWRQHLKLFAKSGKYRAEVNADRQRLKCK